MEKEYAERWFDILYPVNSRTRGSVIYQANSRTKGSVTVNSLCNNNTTIQQINIENEYQASMKPFLDHPEMNCIIYDQSDDIDICIIMKQYIACTKSCFFRNFRFET